ncbi:YfaZ family protein [Halomonas sp. McH1-25]|uniref:YfaZ family outer membrane protein n=1 Tax=unclassified Halomonas TaxID=2609666 RepID=UPI001EF3EA4A|nr:MULTISPECIES: YfaZ family outer membrane protein [unclassified Halomonas]MCG7599711.1 YfaZ family protein [Halomonas sp. McH1-25]MCP1342795.1 YfaZ family protein [Halomonas sp. FL8]MCP1360865.1 YfaZ family protein [Halomonas sp. BBD45]MCP1365778.1 YfaZ family protein [Halomonas sp. BBD48]
MKRTLALLGSVGLLSVALQAQALSLSASGGSDSFGVEASQSIAPTLRAGVGYFTSEDSGHDVDIYSGSLMFSPYLPGIDLAVGGRYQYQDAYYGDGGALGLGGSAFVDTPIPLTSVGGYGFYAPEGLSHGDIEKSYQYGAEVRVNLVSQTYLHAGYRYYRTDFENEGEHTLHSGPTFGVSVGF